MEIRTCYLATRTGRLKRVDYVVPAERGVETAEGDSKDCAIRAICNVTGKSHAEVAVVAEQLGRVKGKGCPAELTFDMMMHYGLSLRATCGTTIAARHYTRIADARGMSYRRCPGITIASSLHHMKQGKWIVLRRGHAFAVINGKIIDKSVNSPDASVAAIFRAPD